MTNDVEYCWQKWNSPNPGDNLWIYNILSYTYYLTQQKRILSTAIPQQVGKLLFCVMSLEVVLIKLFPHLPGANELRISVRRCLCGYACRTLSSLPRYKVGNIHASSTLGLHKRFVSFHYSLTAFIFTVTSIEGQFDDNFYNSRSMHVLMIPLLLGVWKWVISAVWMWLLYWYHGINCTRVCI